MHTKIYDFNLPPNGVQRLDVTGDLFKVVSSLGTVEISTDTGAQAVCDAGQGVRGFGFNTLLIRDRSGAQNSGAVVVGQTGRGDIIDDRVTGEVSVIDGGKALALGLRSFLGNGYCAAVAAQSALVQLWNPVTSTKRLVVSQISFSSASAQAVYMGSDTQPLSNVGVAPMPKLIGGSTAGRVAQVRISNQVGTPVSFNMATAVYLSASQQSWLSTKDPFVIPPGYGITVITQNGSTDLGVMFDFYQESLP